MTGLHAAAPRDCAALKALLAEASGPLCYIAGGTDLLIAPREPPRTGWIVDISRTCGLREIAVEDQTLRIGAAVTLSELIASDLVRSHVPVLARAADLCGSVQIRNRATLGGNVANASPAGDLLPVLLCLDAQFRVMGRDGSDRLVGFDDLVLGREETSLAPGDLISRIDVPLSPRLGRCGFVKLGRRDDLTISRLNLAMEADIDWAEGRFGEVRLVAGAIAPKPLRLAAVEAGLAGRRISPDAAAGFVEALLAAVDAAIPGRASQAYKRRAIMGVGLDLLAEVTGREIGLP